MGSQLEAAQVRRFSSSDITMAPTQGDGNDDRPFRRRDRLTHNPPVELGNAAFPSQGPTPITVSGHRNHRFRNRGTRRIPLGQSASRHTVDDRAAQPGRQGGIAAPEDPRHMQDNVDDRSAQARRQGASAVPDNSRYVQKEGVASQAAGSASSATAGASGTEERQRLAERFLEQADVMDNLKQALDGLWEEDPSDVKETADALATVLKKLIKMTDELIVITQRGSRR